MERFDNRGMLIVPNPIRPLLAKAAKVMVACDLYCERFHRTYRDELLNPYPVPRLERSRRGNLLVDDAVQ